MASEIAALGRAAARLAHASPMTADLTRATLDRAIRQTIANFPVYRTYIDLAGTPDDADLRDLAWAITRARRSDPDLHPSAFDLLEAALTGNAEALRRRSSAGRRRCASPCGCSRSPDPSWQRASKTPRSIATTGSSP